MQGPRWHAFGLGNWSLILAIGLGCAFSQLPAFAADSFDDDDDDADEAPVIQRTGRRSRLRWEIRDPACTPNWNQSFNSSPGCANREANSFAPGSGPMSPDTGALDPNANPSNSLMDQVASGDTGAAIGRSNFDAASGSVGGYLDLAAPVTMFWERYDDALNNNVPDRGEYFYAQCGCFRQGPGLALNPHVKGPPGATDSVNFQRLTSHIEYAFSTRFSTFAELPAEWVHFNTTDPTSPGNASGFGDMNVGFKYAFIAEPDRYLTFQSRTYIPTGDSSRGLGTAHVSIESGLLYYQRLSSRWIVQAEFKEFAPIQVTSFASNVLQYGAGIGYRLFQSNNMVVTPTLESVGWTFLGGQELINESVQKSAGGETIINIKPGVRVGLSDVDSPSGLQRHSVYFGWGHPITDQRLYKDIFRIEYRFLF